MFPLKSIFLLLILCFSFVFAHGDPAEIEEIINNNVSCSKLSDKQLDMIGEYYLLNLSYQKAQNILDASEDKGKEAYVDIAKKLYCKEEPKKFPFWILLPIAGILVIIILLLKRKK